MDNTFRETTFRLHKTGTDFWQEVPAKESLLPWMRRGLQYTATGYGAKIPTRWMVQIDNKWRRVYCAIWSNAGTCYIGKLENGLTIN